MNIITCALPYANGNLHIGHFFEATLADIKARYKRTQSHITFVSGNDCHGAATTLYCQQHNLDIATHLDAQHRQHSEAYQYLKITFDNFSKTNSDLHQKVVNWSIKNILQYEKIHNIKLLEARNVLSWYDEVSYQFLPDRYVKGQCPHCGVLNQAPEVCENCSKAIPDLINPYSVLTQQPVAKKETCHLTLNCKTFYNEVKKQSHLLHLSIKAKILDSSVEKQNHLDISRDAPYYGIKVEGFPELESQYYYVWLDAPIGYLSFAFELSGLEPSQENFISFLEDLELEHFIGKDIAYFHTFLWLNLLKIISNDKSRVTKLNFHGWITLNKEKFSKSKGHSFDLSKLNSEQIDALRFYFFTKSDGSISDTEYSQSEVVGLYNQIVTHGLANFYARTTKILEKNHIQIQLKCLSIPEKYTQLLDSSQYKKLSELLQSDLAQLNAQFQTSELWKCSDTQYIKNTCTIWLEDWHAIYQVLCFVCPQLKEHDTSNCQFTHLASRLKEFNLF